ncbi:acyl-CoA thioesterase [Candidatus Spyradosoma sp. SGI.093]|uniref:acyl-CoA thioesterase n=1 Tax=Candidatus Spyradosoma sp. SGI.093 TaxID=3420583 RepID=UPI003CFF3D54
MNDSAPKFSRFETEMQVRPDDIDLYQHVHSSRYIDYVLAARFDQMERCYKMSMQEFAARGLGWYQTSITMNYKRALGLGDAFIVETGIVDFADASITLTFKIIKKDTRKLVADGHASYALIDLKTKRATKIPQDVIDKYTI